MGDVHAWAVLAFSTATLGRFIQVFILVYIALIFAYVLSSWVQPSYSSPLAKVQQFLHDVCDPYLRLFRRVVRPIGPLDLSPMFAILVLIVISRLVARFL